MADINAIAKQFTDFYYSTFDSNRAHLNSLYVRPSPHVYDLQQSHTFVQRHESMLSWEGNPFQGAAAITEKLTVTRHTKSPTLDLMSANIYLDTAL
jgi:hypothetical protein